MNPPSDPSPSCRSWPFVHPVRPRCTLATRTTPADCPSGQWERTVNPSAYAYPGSNHGSATEPEGVWSRSNGFELRDSPQLVRWRVGGDANVTALRQHGRLG